MRIITPIILLFIPLTLLAQDRSRLAEFAALQEAVQQAIARAEPSIACILVSQSDGYKEFGAAPSSTPGQLGVFLPPPPPPLSHERDPRLRQKILSLDLSNPDTVPQSYGSGVVIDPAGLVLTNAHVVQKATKIYVRLPGGRGSWANIHASDPRSDLAVLQLIRPPEGLKAIRLGDGSKLRKGTFVLSLANPFAAGFRDGSPSASWGIVSNVRRRASGMTTDVDRARLTLHHLGTLMQTDVRLHVGCSGGALLNLDGELVGLTTALAALSGGETPGGFAVPLDGNMRRIIEVLRRGEEVEYGFLGVYLDPPQLRAARGVHLLRVAENSPARRGGLASGDIIVSINGEPVDDNDDLFLLIGAQLAGNTARIEALCASDGRTRTYQVTMAKFQVPGVPIVSRRPLPRLGLRVDYTSTMGRRDDFSIPAGVVIREVIPGSPAERARLQVESVIRLVNRHEVFTPADFYREMDRAAGRVELTLNNDGKEERVLLQR
jgi:S1-C subfamily serine protease